MTHDGDSERSARPIHTIVLLTSSKVKFNSFQKAIPQKLTSNSKLKRRGVGSNA